MHRYVVSNSCESRSTTDKNFATAYGVFHIKSGHLKNWQYLFIIEGAATGLIAIIAWFWLPLGPGSAWFLNEKDRLYAAQRIRMDNAMYSHHTYEENGLEDDKLTKRDVVETAKDWKLWYVLFFNILASVPGQAFSVFLPLVVKGLGYSSINANLVRSHSRGHFLDNESSKLTTSKDVRTPIRLRRRRTIHLRLQLRPKASPPSKPPQFPSFSRLTPPPRKERGYHILFGLLIALLGLIITVTAHAHGAKYAGLCILLFGSYVSAPLTVAWLSGNTPEPGKRALVLGVNGFGNLAGVIGAQLFRESYAPEYLTYAFSFRHIPS